MKRVCRPKENHLRSARCCGQMHRRRIHRDEQSRLRHERGQREQIGFAGKIDNRLPLFRFDLGQMRLLER